jgi:uncharacterized protein
MKQHFAIFTGGFLFALGLGISGMTDANKVIGFLNLAGEWDPSLAFVMVGAISVHLTFFHLILKRKSPLFAERFHIPKTIEIDRRLVVGSALFGAGWGLGGICPGPGVVSIMGFGMATIVFVLFMLGGMVLQKVLHQREGHLTRAKETTC